jgi:hypothetical protein
MVRSLGWYLARYRGFIGRVAVVGAVRSGLGVFELVARVSGNDMTAIGGSNLNFVALAQLSAFSTPCRSHQHQSGNIF